MYVKDADVQAIFKSPSSGDHIAVGGDIWLIFLICL